MKLSESLKKSGVEYVLEWNKLDVSRNAFSALLFLISKYCKDKNFSETSGAPVK